MKYNFYKKRMIFRILMYLVLYGVFFIWHLYKHQFLWRYAFQGWNGFGFVVYSALTISFITTVVMIVSLMLELIFLKGENHVFTIIQLIIAIGVNVILWKYGDGDMDIILYSALNCIVWICWGIEFIRRELC